MTNPGDLLASLSEQVTAKWAKQRKAEERDRSARLRRADRMLRYRRVTIRDAAFEVMRDAYMAASANGTLPANPRQIMYAARPLILERTTDTLTLNSQYFCQRLLVDFIDCYPSVCADWDIIWDDRGHLHEPHTGTKIGVGTLGVRNYIGGCTDPDLVEAGLADAHVKTCGPDGCYGAVLYIEKEGFLPILSRARLAEKFDIALLSCKGQSTTAARQLIDQTCARYNAPLLILHDFDISGFSIASNLHRSGRRYQFDTKFKVIDFGLRLADVERLALESEEVWLGSKNARKLATTLRRNGATEDEIEFLLSSRRVELNAMTSDQFIAFIEGKLAENGIRKIIPRQDKLADAYRLFARSRRVAQVVEEALERQYDEDEGETPADLETQVRNRLADNPSEPWHEAVKRLVESAA